MSARLPLQSKAARPRFERKKAVFGGDDDDERVEDEFVVGIEDNQIKEAKPKEKNAPMSIAPLSNADWRSAAKRKRELFIPARAQQPSTTEETKPEVLQQSSDSFGLQIQQKKIKNIIEDGQAITTETVVTEQQIVTNDPQEIQKTLEERAIEAILKESKGELDEEDEGPVKVIPANETIAFRDDVQSRPEEATMEDYENIPVDEFGAALLRGLGWSEGEGIGRNRKSTPAPPPTPVKQREALLGLGAKPEDIEKDARSKYKSRKEAYEYKDTSLFKKISKRKYEDEYDDRHSSRSSSKSSTSSRRSRYDEDDKYKRKRDRSRERHRSYSRDSHSSSRRNRSRSRESRRRSRSRESRR
ncbi:hypothetical protein G6F37_004566 [Rhizopus arrhizus]|nr:hypothetical protein G6F38_004814 [Rhizopus arrhizus]KAG1159792.1 hypothetical protein G6F37_004566 [Rhizopus arrhizus]